MAASTALSVSTVNYFPIEVTEAVVTSTLNTGMNPIRSFKKRDMMGNILFARNISTDQNANVDIRLQEDTQPIDETNSYSITHSTPFDISATMNFTFGLYNASGGAISNFAHRLSYFLFPPSIADKILHSIRLTEAEKKIAKDNDLYNLIDEGSLPIPIDMRIQKIFESKRKSLKSFGRHMSLTATVPAEVAKVYAPVDQAVILHGITSDVSDAFITITADDRDLIMLNSGAALGNTTDLPFFIPCLDSLRIVAVSSGGIADYNCRCTVEFVKRTKYMNLIWGLASRADNADLGELIQAGLIE